jgi:hypothetical protein
MELPASPPNHFRKTFVFTFGCLSQITISDSPFTGRSVIGIGMLATDHNISTIISRFYAVLQPDTRIGLEQSQDFTCLMASTLFSDLEGVMSSLRDGFMNIYTSSKQSESITQRVRCIPTFRKGT